MTKLHMQCFVFEKYPDIDYEPWLGPNWKKELEDYKKPVPTIITNHSSFLDIWLLLCSKWMPAFLAKFQVKSSIVGKQCDALQSLYVDRRGDKDAKDKTVS